MIIETTCNDICKEVNEFFNLQLNSCDEIFKANLTGNDIRLNGISLTYLFFHIEKIYDIKINTDDILNYEFNTINGIADLVNTTLAKKEITLC